MKRCDCEHWEICPTCFPQGFDEEGNRKPVEMPPTRAELVEKVAELEAENKRLKTDLSNCDGELAHYQAAVAQQAEENARCLQANRDWVDHFEALKEEFNKQAERIKELETLRGNSVLVPGPELKKMQEKLAAAEKDAERYRYFCANVGNTDSRHPIRLMMARIGMRTPTKQELDEAIDAAITEGK